MLNSGQKRDKCGVCGGDNSTCILHTITNHNYSSGLMKYGYNPVVTLPVNASSVLITQRSADSQVDDNYLAVRTSNKSLFNGNYIVMIYGLETTLKNGAIIEFSGSEQVEESIVIKSVIAEELIVEVCGYFGTYHWAHTVKCKITRFQCTYVFLHSMGARKRFRPCKYIVKDLWNITRCSFG